LSSFHCSIDTGHSSQGSKTGTEGIPSHEPQQINSHGTGTVVLSNE
jgi:hypothetical protein